MTNLLTTSLNVALCFPKSLDNRKSIYIVCIPFVVSGLFKSKLRVN